MPQCMSFNACCFCLWCTLQVLALEMMILMLENPSDDSVEVAVDFCKDVGAYLQVGNRATCVICNLVQT